MVVKLINSVGIVYIGCKYMKKYVRKSKPINITLDPETRELLERLARELGISKSAVIRVAIRKLEEELSSPSPAPRPEASR